MPIAKVVVSGVLAAGTPTVVTMTSSVVTETQQQPAPPPDPGDGATLVSAAAEDAVPEAPPADAGEWGAPG